MLKLVIGKKNFYHGSPKKLKKLKLLPGGKDYGNGIYLTANYKKAMEYALKNDTSGYVYHVEVNAKKPFDPYNTRDVARLVGFYSIPLDKLKKYKIKNLEDRGYFDIDKNNAYFKIQDMTHSTDINTALKQLGFDSIFDSKRNWFVLFKENQAKIIKVDQIDKSRYNEIQDLIRQGYY